nr:polyprenol monophosphomannose synthase [Bacteriovorax sp. HI3]
MINQSLVIIPTYNEALNVDSMIERLFTLYPDISVLIIDDNSPDKTALVVEALKTKHPNLFLIKRAGKLGLGTAYVEGFKWALLKKFKFIAQMDCDFSHDPKDLGRLITALYDGTAIAIGSRYSGNDIRTKDWPWYRLLISLSAGFILRLFTGLKIRDISGGFKCFKREALEKINFDNIISKGYVFQFEMTYKVHAMGYDIVEIPIVFSERVYGKSKMNLGIVLEAFSVMFRLRLKKLFNQLN